jgi:hypothetical protein
VHSNGQLDHSSQAHAVTPLQRFCAALWAGTKGPWPPLVGAIDPEAPAALPGPERSVGEEPDLARFEARWLSVSRQ